MFNGLWAIINEAGIKLAYLWFRCRNIYEIWTMTTTNSSELSITLRNWTMMSRCGRYGYCDTTGWRKKALKSSSYGINWERSTPLPPLMPALHGYWLIKVILSFEIKTWMFNFSKELAQCHRRIYQESQTITQWSYNSV